MYREREERDMEGEVRERDEVCIEKEKGETWRERSERGRDVTCLLAD